MKKLLLILAFASFYIFVPFIYLNCSGQDLPYIIGAQPSFSDEEKLEECLKLDVMISSCVDILQEYEETLKTQENTVASVAQTLDSFEYCQTEESMTDATLSVVKYQIEETDEETVTDDETGTETDTTTDTDTDEVSETEDAVTEPTTCVTIVADMVTAYQVCASLSDADKFDSCNDVEHAMTSAQGLCGESDDSVTVDFCANLSAF